MGRIGPTVALTGLLCGQSRHVSLKKCATRKDNKWQIKKKWASFDIFTVKISNKDS